MADVKQLVEDLLVLQERYSFTKRNLVTADRYEQIAKQGLVSEDDYTNEVLREPLLEHVGHLPVLATFLHPHIEHSDEVDLGRVLTMLAVHDIGETVVGDVFTYNKTEADDKAEYEAALDLLPKPLHKIYEDYEQRVSRDSLYAKSIDALAPITHSMYRAKVKIDHFKLKGATIQDVIDKKAAYFEWDKVLKEIFELCIEHYQRVDRGEMPVFKQYS